MRHPIGKRRLPGRKAQLWFFAGLSAVLLVTTIALAAQVLSRVEGYLDTDRPAAVSDVTHLEALLLNLQAALVAHPQDARKAFEGLQDGVHQFSEGIAQLGAPEDLARDLDALSGQVKEMSAYFDNPVSALPVPELLDRTHSLIALTVTISAGREDARAESLRSEHAQLISKLIQLTVLSLALLLTLLSLTALLWQLYRLYRRRALENRSTLDRLTTILNTSQDAVLVVRPDGRIIDTNRAANRMFFGGTPGFVPQVEHVLRRRQEDGSLIRITGRMLMKSCASGPNLCSRVVAQDADGNQFPIELSADQATRSGGPVVICFLRNIARRVADEAELVAARDTALSGEQAKARFLGMISHEMRTPLNGLLGTLDLLQDTGLTAEQRRYAKIMQNSGQMLLDQINDALDITQANKNGLSLSPEAFDLDHLIAELVRAQTLTANVKGNQLKYVAGKTPLGTVTGDPGRIRQVLLNLVSNAIKFTPRGTITLEACRLNDTLVEFQVVDTGIGIADEDQVRIFDDFMRLDTADTAAIEGSGLGLGIVRHLVTLMGGEIGVESALGHGSIFWVRLPLPCVTDAPPVPGNPAGDPSSRLNVLVVEDHAINRELLQDMLRREGHPCCGASNGAEGVRKAEGQKFDLIIMDISMPVMTGTEAAAAIRAGDGPSSKSYILALSAHVTPELAQAPDFDQILRKPFRQATLKSVLTGLSVEGASSEDSALLDAGHLDQLRTSLGAARVDALITAFVEDGDALLTDDTRMGRRENADLAAQLHHIAGFAATLGAQRLQRALGTAQAALANGDRRSLTPLPALWRQTRTALRNLHVS